MTNLEQIDLAVLCGSLRTKFGDTPPRGYVLGKTAIREVLLTLSDCSELEAEALVDTLEARGFLRYEGDPTRTVDDLEHAWTFVTP